MSRRSFLQFCATLATTLGLPKGAEAAMAQAMEAAQRPSVIWLHFQECTGCTESMLRAEHPTHCSKTLQRIVHAQKSGRIKAVEHPDLQLQRWQPG